MHGNGTTAGEGANASPAFSEIMMNIKTSRGPDDVWIAIDVDTYDVESDSVGAWSTSATGYGDTEIGAIKDLLDQIEDRLEQLDQRLERLS